MKRLLVAASITVAMCGQAFGQSSVEQALMDLERQWVKASLASNGEALAPFLASNIVVLGSDGTMQTKAAYVAMTNKAKWQVNEISDMKAQVHGDTAVVTGMWTGKGTDGAGKAFDGRERFADTWVKMPDGKWQCVATASATIK